MAFCKLEKHQGIVQNQQIDQIQFSHNFVLTHLSQHLNSKIKIAFYTFLVGKYEKTTYRTRSNSWRNNWRPLTRINSPEFT